MNSVEPDLSMHRALIEACLRNLVPFAWHSPGTLLIAGSGIGAVLRDVMSAGHHILGFEGFELASAEIHPRLDLIFDSELRLDAANPIDVAATWPTNVWVDVTLKADRTS